MCTLPTPPLFCSTARGRCLKLHCTKSIKSVLLMNAAGDLPPTNPAASLFCDPSFISEETFARSARLTSAAALAGP
jgi:hypothetical protein